METAIVFSFAITSLIITTLVYFSFKKFVAKYEVVVFNKEDEIEQLEVDQEQTTALDLRGRPTHVCVCGSQVWLLKVVFNQYEIATYFLDMYCVECGSLATAPTPLDREELEN